MAAQAGSLVPINFVFLSCKPWWLFSIYQRRGEGREKGAGSRAEAQAPGTPQPHGRSRWYRAGRCSSLIKAFGGFDKRPLTACATQGMAEIRRGHGPATRPASACPLRRGEGHAGQEGPGSFIPGQIAVPFVTIRGSEIIGGLRETTHGDTT